MSQAIFHNLISSNLTPPPIPDFHDVTRFSGTQHSHCNIGTRQLALEPSVAGVDRAMSWSMWLRPSNIINASSRILGAGPTTNSNLSYGLSIQPSSLQSATLNQRLSMALFTTFASAAISINSSAKILRGRWVHVVCTYDGSESGNGLNFYFNKVLDSGAIKASVGYTGMLNDSNARFFVGAVQSSTVKFGGDITQLAVWDKALNQTEIDELYANGSVIDVDTVSFYGANIEAYYPMKTNVNCLNSATFNLGTVTNITFGNIPVGPNFEQMSLFNSVDTNTLYYLTGNFVKVAGGFAWYGARSTSHLAGSIVKVGLNISGMAGATPAVVLAGGTSIFVNVSAGDLPSVIAFFTARQLAASPGVFTGIDRYESTDGLVGDTFSLSASMPTVETIYSPYGKLVPGYNGEYFSPEYEQNAGGTVFTINRYKRDSGGVWSAAVVWTGNATLSLQEAAIINCGNNVMIVLARSATQPGLYMISSTDGGATWSGSSATNLGAGITMCDGCLDPYGNLIVIYCDRSDGRLKITGSNAIADILADPTDWNASGTLFEGYTTDSLNLLGYPSIVRHGWNYCISFLSEFSSSRADLYFGYGRLDV